MEGASDDSAWVPVPPRVLGGSWTEDIVQEHVQPHSWGVRGGLGEGSAPNGGLRGGQMGFRAVSCHDMGLPLMS